MLLPEAADAYLPLVANWLLGEAIEVEERPPLGLKMVHAGRIHPGYPEDIAEMPDETIAVVSLKGELTKYDGLCSYGANSIANLVRVLGVSKNISGLVMDVDGPGGAVNAIAPVLEAVDFFRAQGKPAGYHADLIASAHYYIGSHGDFLMLDNTISSRAGSIGTMIQFMDYQKYWESKGIKLHTIYATQSTHKNKEFDEALDGNYDKLRAKLLDPLAAKFQSDVIAARGSKLKKDVEGILSGSMFFAEEAVQIGLADGIGTLGDAIQRVSDLRVIKQYMSK